MPIELDLAYKQHLYEQENERKEMQEKMYYYYNGDEDKVLEYLDEALLKTFDDDSVSEFQKDYLNLTKKIIHETAVVYNEPPQREILTEGEENEELTEYYQNIFTIRSNSKDKKIHRYGKLFNTAIMEIFFNKITEKIDYKIDPPHLYTVIPHEEDYNRIGMIMYDKYFKNDKNKDELYTVVWTETEHYRLDAQGEKVAIEGNEEMINPYGVIPFVVYRTEEMPDFWGVGQHDITNANEIVNVFLTDLANGTLMSAWGTPLFVNCGLDKKSSDREDDEVKRLRVGPKHPISVDNVTTEMVAPRIEYVAHNAEMEAVMEIINYRIQLIANNKGLDPNIFSLEVKATSGFSKMMDRINQIEIRQDDLEPCKEFEHERYEVVKAVHNYEMTDVKGFKELPTESKLKVDFAEIDLPQTIEEKWKEREEKEKRSMATPVDWLMEENPDLTKEEAEEIIQNNKEFLDSTVNAEPRTNFQALIEGNQTTEEENDEDDNT